MCSLFAHTIVSDVAKDVIIPQFAKGELAPVAVREKVLQGMKTGAHETVGLPKVCPLAPSGTATVLDAGTESAADESCRCIPSSVLRSHVILQKRLRMRTQRTVSGTYFHAGSLINLEFFRVYWRTKLRVKLASIAFLLCVTPAGTKD